MHYLHFQLEKYHGISSRHECPRCGRKRCFTYYIDDDGNVLDPTVGRCDHESSCGYHYTPKEYFTDHPERADEKADKNRTVGPLWVVHAKKKKDKSLCTIPSLYVDRSLDLLFDSDLVCFLSRYFGAHTLSRIVKDYFLGVTKDRRTIFWQIDENLLVRAGKIMRYNDNGHRVKEAVGAINWVHSIMERNKLLPDDWELTQCLFGQHLLRMYPDRLCIIVEAEKTAVICSAIYPQYNWLATGGKDNFKPDEWEMLKGRKIIVCPDIDGYPKWEKEARLAKKCTIIVSDFLKKNATEEDREKNADIADPIIRDLEPFRLDRIWTEPTKEEKLLEGMKDKNPAIGTLVENLDLQLIMNTTTAVYHPWQK